MSKRPDIEKEQARVMQMQAAQEFLFSMDVLGENVAGYQMEIEGVLQSLVVRRCSQAEFYTIMQEAARDARAARARPAGS